MTRGDHARKAAIRARMAATHEPYSIAARNAGIPARPATGIGTPPAGWPSWAASLPATVAVWRDRNGFDEVAVVAHSGRRLERLKLPHVPTERLLADDLPDQDLRLVTALGRPDLTAHRLGYLTRGPWHPWTDGSWRSPATPADTRHTVTASPTMLTVLEHPGDHVVAKTVIGEAVDEAGLDAALNRLGFGVVGGEWVQLPGGVRYARARPSQAAS